MPYTYTNWYHNLALQNIEYSNTITSVEHWSKCGCLKHAHMEPFVLKLWGVCWEYFGKKITLIGWHHISIYSCTCKLWYNDIPNLVFQRIFVSFELSNSLKFHFRYLKPLKHRCCSLSSLAHYGCRYKYKPMTCYTYDFSQVIPITQKHSVLDYFIHDSEIATKLCTCHGSRAVMTCAKLCCNGVTIFRREQHQILIEFEYWWKNASEMGPNSL